MIVRHNILGEIRFIKNHINDLQKEIDNYSKEIILYKDKRHTIRILKNLIKIRSFHKLQWENRLKLRNKRLSKLII